MLEVQLNFREQFFADSTTLKADDAKWQGRGELEPSPAERGEVQLSYGVYI